MPSSNSISIHEDALEAYGSIQEHSPSTSWIFKYHRRIYVFLENPRSSLGAYLFSMFIACTVIISSLILIVETLPAFYQEKSSVW